MLCNIPFAFVGWWPACNVESLRGFQAESSFRASSQVIWGVWSPAEGNIMRNGWPLLDTHLSDKFQEWTPGKQMHERERGRQESPDPSPADTMTRRPNVNGQIALNNSADQKGMVRWDASLEGRTVLPARATGLSSLASLGDHSIESISCRRVGVQRRVPSTLSCRIA